MKKSNPEQVRLLRSGVDAWNSWRKKEKVKAAKKHLSLSESDCEDEEYLNAAMTDLMLCLPELREVNFSNLVAHKADLASAQLWRRTFRVQTSGKRFCLGQN